jgi:hypothetical protein
MKRESSSWKAIIRIVICLSMVMAMTSLMADEIKLAVQIPLKKVDVYWGDELSLEAAKWPIKKEALKLALAKMNYHVETFLSLYEQKLKEYRLQQQKASKNPAKTQSAQEQYLLEKAFFEKHSFHQIFVRENYKNLNQLKEVDWSQDFVLQSDMGISSNTLVKYYESFMNISSARKLKEIVLESDLQIIPTQWSLIGVAAKEDLLGPLEISWKRWFKDQIQQKKYGYDFFLWNEIGQEAQLSPVEKAAGLLPMNDNTTDTMKVQWVPHGVYLNPPVLFFSKGEDQDAHDLKAKKSSQVLFNIFMDIRPALDQTLSSANKTFFAIEMDLLVIDQLTERTLEKISLKQPQLEISFQSPSELANQLASSLFRMPLQHFQQLLSNPPTLTESTNKHQIEIKNPLHMALVYKLNTLLTEKGRSKKIESDLISFTFDEAYLQLHYQGSKDILFDLFKLIEKETFSLTPALSYKVNFTDKSSWDECEFVEVVKK